MIRPAKGFAHESSVNESVEWYTPPSIFQALAITFDVDPCHPEGERLPWVPAATTYNRQDDGLSKNWTGKRVWLNPPYGRDIDVWMRRMAANNNGIALVFGRTDTRWFQQAGATAHGICFIAGRVTFVDRTGKGDRPAPAPSILLAWSADCAEALLRCGLGPVYLQSRLFQ